MSRVISPSIQSHGILFGVSALLLGWGSFILLGNSNDLSGTAMLSVLPLYAVPSLVLAIVHFVAWQLYVYN
jgi:hypothetical protein